MLKGIKDTRTRKSIMERIGRLAVRPVEQGKPLLGELAGLYSVRAGGQRFRILYSVEKGKVLVIVVAVGLRKEGAKKDIYLLAKKLLRQRLL